MQNCLIFSDLDGTLLDHKSYSFSKAKPALKLIKEKEIPLILTSSKTHSEIKKIQYKLSNNDPFIFENGSGVSYKGQIVNFGIPHKIIQQELTKLSKSYKFKCYTKLKLIDVMRLTGLSETNAKLSQQRKFSEPIIWTDDAHKKDMFLNEVKKYGLIGVTGGRFLTISSHHDKAKALNWVKLKIEKEQNQSFKTIGLGDGKNDINMINACDIKILIKNNNENLHQKNWIYSKKIGPSGWNEEIIKVLKNE